MPLNRDLNLATHSLLLPYIVKLLIGNGTAVSDNIESCLRTANLKEIKAFTGVKKSIGVRSLILNLDR